jgi:hypothetical protein
MRPPVCRVMKFLTSIIGGAIKQALVTVVHDGCPAKRVCRQQIEIRLTSPILQPRKSRVLQTCDGRLIHKALRTRAGSGKSRRPAPANGRMQCGADQCSLCPQNKSGVSFGPLLTEWAAKNPPATSSRCFPSSRRSTNRFASMRQGIDAYAASPGRQALREVVSTLVNPSLGEERRCPAKMG